MQKLITLNFLSVNITAKKINRINSKVIRNTNKEIIYLCVYKN